MKLYNKLVAFILISFITIFFYGCWDTKIYETIGFILQLGIDASEDGRLKISYTSPVTDPKRKEQVEFVSSSVSLMREFREKARMITPKKMEGGKMQQVVIGESLGRKGIINLLELFERDPELPSMAYVVISEDSAHDLLNHLQGLTDKPRPSIYLNSLIDDNSNSGYTPKTTCFDFSAEYLAPGIDPITPLVRKETKEAKGVKIMGSAIFSGDKMVGKLNPKDTSLIVSMRGQLPKATEYIFTSIGPPENDNTGKRGAAVSLRKPKRKIIVRIENNKPVVDIRLQFKGTYDEHGWNHINKKENEMRYEKMMEKELTDECMKVLEYTQEVNSDPLGIGDMIRAKHNAYWKSVKWEDTYKSVVFHIDAKVSLIGHGIIN